MTFVSMKHAAGNSNTTSGRKKSAKTHNAVPQSPTALARLDSRRAADVNAHLHLTRPAGKLKHTA